VREFLAGKRIAVTGVSRDRRHFANLIYRKPQASGHDGVLVASLPAASLAIVGQCADRGVRRIWFHRSFGDGSVSAEAVRECEARGISCIVGGCPMMYVAPIDPAHRCMRWLLRWGGRVPG
jgi:hypothetical protein